LLYRRRVTLSDEYLAARANNLTLVRLVLASSVIYTHCYWTLSGASGADDLSGFLGEPISVYAVDGFFFLSGFLVYASLLRLNHSGRFLLARLTRLWPALFMSVFITALVGLAITSAPAPAYFRGETARFLFGNLSLIFAAYNLTGVQCGDALCNVNGSLWTLPFEIRGYLLLAALGAVGLARPEIMKRVILPATLVGAVLWDLPPVRVFAQTALSKGLFYQIDMLDRLWTLFALGVAAYLWRDKIRLSWVALALLFAVNLVAHRLGIGLHVRALFIGYAVLCAGMLSAKNGAISGRWPDYSYGMYIYAFPVMVALTALWPTRSHIALALANAAATLPLAALSWHFIEKPALDWFRERKRPRLRPIEGTT
jgi:peptidoglycan/LPS O-acetylase OafA/YrhL